MLWGLVLFCGFQPPFKVKAGALYKYHTFFIHLFLLIYCFFPPPQNNLNCFTKKHIDNIDKSIDIGIVSLLKCIQIKNLGSSHSGSLVTNHEVVGLIPGLTQWVKRPGIAVSCGIGRRHSSDLALPWLWHRPAKL